MYNTITAKMWITTSLTTSDIRCALEGSGRYTRIMGDDSLFLLKSCDEKQLELSAPINFCADNIEATARTYLEFAKEMLFTEGIWTIHMGVEDKVLVEFSYAVLWDSDRMISCQCFGDDVNSRLHEILKLYDQVEDKKNCHFTSLLEKYPDLLDKFKKYDEAMRKWRGED